MQRFKNLEEQAHDNGNQRCQHHALHAEGAEGNFGSGQADDHDYRRHYQIGRFAVINLALDQHADAGSGDNAEKQDADTAHDRYGNTVDDLGELAAEGQDDGQQGSAADYPGAVNFGDGHYADVFAVCSIRRGAGEAGDNVGQAVGKKGAGKARVFDKVALNDVAGNYQMADVFCQHYEGCGSDDHDGVQIKGRRVEVRHLEPGGVDDGLEIDHAHKGCENIAADDAEKNGDDAHKAAEGDGADNTDCQSKHGYGDIGRLDVLPVSPAMPAATGASSRPMTAMMAPIAAGGKIISIQRVPIKWIITENSMNSRPKTIKPDWAAL